MHEDQTERVLMPANEIKDVRSFGPRLSCSASGGRSPVATNLGW
jgi:hypothetical protein